MTVINHNQKFVFIHNPKTGGGTITKLLMESFSSSISHDLGPFAMHANMPQMKSLSEGYFSFGFVRNPWDRIFSKYKRDKREQKKVIPNSPPISRDDFRTWFFNPEIQDIRMFKFDQVSWVKGVDFIGRFERYETDLREILTRLGLVDVEELPWMNKTDDTYSYHSVYDNETIRIIAEKFREDIIKFGYSF